MSAPFRPPPGTRFPLKNDLGRSFGPAGPLRGRLTFDEILDYHSPSRAEFTLFRVRGHALAGAACFGLEEQQVRLDFLTRNARFVTPHVSVGSVLLAAVEAFAEFHGREAVVLEAMDDAGLVLWYESRRFVFEGPPYRDPQWGRLFPMVKRVAPLRLGPR